jgi:hypothetical protein
LKNRIKVWEILLFNENFYMIETLKIRILLFLYLKNRIKVW